MDRDGRMENKTKSAKEIARDLGLLRKRPLQPLGLTRVKAKKSKDDQTFAYLIIIDFESTCWENDKSCSPEIIEFPAVLMNTSDGQIESEFHYYLQPSERPTLSAFCHQLTGITQHQVDEGIPLSMCLRKFSSWLRRLREEKGVVCADDDNIGTDTPGQKVAAIVTWSDWDMGVCLLYEAKRKQLSKPSALDRWIDLRLTYRKFYERKPDGLNGALQDLGLIFDGRQHSGLDDSRNTARVAWRMICDGCQMNITKTLKMGINGNVERISSPLEIRSIHHCKPRQSELQVNKSSKSVRCGSFSILLDKDCDVTSAASKTKAKKQGLKIVDHNVNQSKPSPSKLQDTSIKPVLASRSSTVLEMTPLQSHKPKPVPKQCLFGNKLIKSPNSRCNSQVVDRAMSSKIQLITPVRHNKEYKHKSSPTKSIRRSPRLMKTKSEELINAHIFVNITPSQSAFHTDTKNNVDIFDTPKSNLLDCGKQYLSSDDSGCFSSNTTPTFSSDESGIFSKDELEFCFTDSSFSEEDSCTFSKNDDGNFLKGNPVTFRKDQFENCSKDETGLDSKCITSIKSKLDKPGPNIPMSNSSKCTFSTPSSNNVSKLPGSAVTPLSRRNLSTNIYEEQMSIHHSTTRSLSLSLIVENKNTSVSKKLILKSTPVTSRIVKETKDPQHVNVMLNNCHTVKLQTPLNTTSSNSLSNVLPKNNSIAITPVVSSKVISSSKHFSRSDPGPIMRAPINKFITTPVVSRKVVSHSSIFPSSDPQPVMRATPPLCGCGRRAKRRLVQKQGPNTGRWFFSCSVRTAQSAEGKKKIGCTLFLWETP